MKERKIFRSFFSGSAPAYLTRARFLCYYIHMRRKDRELSYEEGLKIIDKCEYATLSVSDGEVPYSIPLSVCRNGTDVFFHSADAGRKTELLKDGTPVRMVFVGDVEAQKNAFTTAYESAIAVGKIYAVISDAEKISALRLLSEKYCPENMAAFDKSIERSLGRTNVYRVSMESVTAKAKRVKRAQE